MVTLPEPLRVVGCESSIESCNVHDLRPLLHQRPNMPDVTFSPDASALEEAIENSHDCIALVDMQGFVVFMNLPGLWQMELEGDPASSRIAWADLWSREFADLAEYSVESVRSGRACRFTASRLTARGAPKWWDVAVSPMFDRRGCPVQMFCVSRDITGLKERESSLQRALAETQTLLSEAHHRIKNSLGAVASLLALQARQSQDATLHACLQEAQSRVIAVAAIHRQLSEMTARDSLDVGACIADVAHGTIGTLDACVNVELHTACEKGISLRADQAIPLALLTSELITNCAKHAFDGCDGTVDVEFSASPTQLVLCVRDNGRGLPADFDVGDDKGLGMKIVLGLVRQAHGELRIERSGRGAHFVIAVPREHAIGRH